MIPAVLFDHPDRFTDLHASRAKPLDALARLFVRDELAGRIGAAAADFGKLSVGDAKVVTVREVIHQRAGSGILLAVRQLLDLFERIAQKFCHGLIIAGHAQGFKARGASVGLNGKP